MRCVAHGIICCKGFLEVQCEFLRISSSIFLLEISLESLKMEVVCQIYCVNRRGYCGGGRTRCAHLVQKLQNIMLNFRKKMQDFN